MRFYYIRDYLTGISIKDSKNKEYRFGDIDPMQESFDLKNVNLVGVAATVSVSRESEYIFGIKVLQLVKEELQFLDGYF